MFKPFRKVFHILRQEGLKAFFKRIKNEIMPLKSPHLSNRPYTDFAGFHARSLISPEVHAPFQEADKRCFAFMENVARDLLAKAGRLENAPLFSVLMVACNCESMVGDAINSVLKQTYARLELIIVDDGSIDGTAGVLTACSDARVRVIHNETTLGKAASLNHALKAAKGKYIGYIDADTVWDERYLAAMVGAFSVLPDAQSLYGGQLLYREQSEKPYAVRFGALNRALLQNRNYIGHSAFCYRNDILRHVGGYDERLKRFVGWEFILRVAEKCRMYSVPVLLTMYHGSAAENSLENNYASCADFQLVQQISRKRFEVVHAVRPASQYLKHPVSVIIPSYESLDCLKECLAALIGLKEALGLDIIVVDNASGSEVVEYLHELSQSGHIQVVFNDENMGFTFAVNQGIRLAGKGSDILLLNNDAVVTPAAIPRLADAAWQVPSCGIAAPQQLLPGGTPVLKTLIPYVNPEYPCDANINAVHRNVAHVPLYHNGEVLELSFVPFFCVYIRHDVLEQAGDMLDAEFGRHYRSDRIFCDVVRYIIGKKVCHVASAVVHHKFQQSTKALKKSTKAQGAYQTMFIKNQWEPELARRYKFRKAPWDD